MPYELMAVGWVPNIGRKVTSDRHISDHLRGSPERMGVKFTYTDRHILAETVAGDFPAVKIEPKDDSGLCHLYIDGKAAAETWKEIDPLTRLSSEIHISMIWQGFRSLVDSASHPRCSPPSGFYSATDVAENAVCSAMDHPIPISDIGNTGTWADAIAGRFLDDLELKTDSLRSYPMKHRILSNPKRVWNLRKVIDKSLGSSMTVSTNVVYFRSFIKIYCDAITDIDDIEDMFDLRVEKMRDMSDFIKNRMESANLRLLLASIVIALAIGISSIASGVIV